MWRRCTSLSSCSVLHYSHQLSSLRAGARSVATQAPAVAEAVETSFVQVVQVGGDAGGNGLTPLSLSSISSLSILHLFLCLLIHPHISSSTSPSSSSIHHLNIDFSTAIPAASLARTIPTLSDPARCSSCLSGILTNVTLTISFP